MNSPNLLRSTPRSNDRTFEFRMYDPDDRYTESVFRTKCVKVTTAIRRLRRKHPDHPRVRMVELFTHGERDVQIVNTLGIDKGQLIPNTASELHSGLDRAKIILNKHNK